MKQISELPDLGKIFNNIKDHFKYFKEKPLVNLCHGSFRTIQTDVTRLTIKLYQVSFLINFFLFLHA